MNDEQGGKRSVLERALSVFTEVRAGEGRRTLALAANIYLILTAYYIIKPVREALILSGGGAELKSYAAAGQALLMLLVAVPVFSWLAARMPRRRLINTVNLFFVANLVLFYVLAQLDLDLGLVFYLWVGIFNLMVPALFWSFANDICTVEEGKRLFVIVAFGASAGAITGSWVTGQLIEPVGVFQLLLVSAGLLLVALVITNAVEARAERPARAQAPDPEREPDQEEGLGKSNAFALVLRHRYLLLIAVMILLLNWVNTTGEYILGRAVEEQAVAESARLAESPPEGFAREAFEQEFIGKFYADFFTGVNILGVLIQLFLVSRILKYAGVRIAVIILPLIAMGGYLLLALVPVLSLLRVTKTVENATDYSLQNTVRQALFPPTTREQKYKAKQAIDTFFQRAGDVLSAVLVFAGTTWLGLSMQGFALVNVVLAAAWLVAAVMVGRHYRKLTGEEGGTLDR